MWELHSQMQKVLAVCQSPCKRARRCSAHAQGVSDKGGPWTALSFTNTRTNSQGHPARPQSSGVSNIRESPPLWGVVSSQGGVNQSG